MCSDFKTYTDVLLYSSLFSSFAWRTLNVPDYGGKIPKTFLFEVNKDTFTDMLSDVILEEKHCTTPEELF